MTDFRLYLILAPILTAIGFALTVYLIWTLLHRHRSPASTFAWIMAIVLLPYMGIPLYILFGGRKIALSKKYRNLLKKSLKHIPHDDPSNDLLLPAAVSGVYPTMRADEVELITGSGEAFSELLRLIAAAEQSIDICTYILGSDETGLAILDALAQKAGQGVRVRLLLDAYGSMAMPTRVLAPLEEAGGEVAFFMPILRLPFQRRLNLRNHRKLLLFDSQLAVIGGMNLSGQYMGDDQNAEYWVDLCVRITGSGVAHLHEVFESDWAFAHAVLLDDAPIHSSPLDHGGDRRTQFIASGPDVKGDPIHDAILVAIYGAKKRVWIVSPYILPDESLLIALNIAAQRGLDIRLITPEHSNHRVADFARESFLLELQDFGARIFFYTKGMLHGKAIVIDDHLSFVGSANLDMRSMFFNFEIAAGIECNVFCGELTSWMTTILEDCREGVKEKNRFQQVWLGIGRLLAPIL